jgi:hypothetical protein
LEKRKILIQAKAFKSNLTLGVSWSAVSGAISDSDEERGFFSGVFFSADFMDGEVMFVLAEKNREGKK